MRLLVPSLAHLLAPAVLGAFAAALALPAPVATVPGTALPLTPARPHRVAATATASNQAAVPAPAPPAAALHRAISTASSPPVAARFSWPLSPEPAVQRRFEQPASQWSRGHRGVDLRTYVGQPVLSAGDGIVAFSGVVAGRGVITVRHPGGLRTTYEPVDERLAAGTPVQRGARMALVSPTPGHCAPLSCLHWGTIFGQTYRDPLSLLGFGRPILLPLG